MNITFLIGNGFDVNLGLKSQYKDFYPEYIKNNKSRSDDDCIKKFCNKIKSDYENWGDFEYSLAQKFDGTKEELGDILENFTAEFAKYLKEQCKDFIYDDKESLDKFSNFIKKPYECLGKREKENMQKYYESEHEANRFYNFINFNYTDTLSNLISQLKNLGKKGGFWNGSNIFLIKNQLNIHGSLNGEQIIIGIDSLEQFECDSLKNDNEVARYCEKQRMNIENGYSENEITYENIINSSDIIYAYGIGFGETDRKRWSILANWLRKDKSHRLFIFKYNTGFKKINGLYKSKLNIKIDKTKDEYLKILGFNENMFEEMRNQIFVADSSSVLQFKLKKDSSKLVTV